MCVCGASQFFPYETQLHPAQPPRSAPSSLKKRLASLNRFGSFRLLEEVAPPELRKSKSYSHIPPSIGLNQFLVSLSDLVPVLAVRRGIFGQPSWGRA